MTASLQVVIEESFYRNMVTMVAVPKSAFHEGNPRLDSKSVGIRKRILFFFTRQINARSLGSWCVKVTEEFTSIVDFVTPLAQPMTSLVTKFA